MSGKVPAVDEKKIFQINLETKSICWFFGVHKSLKYASQNNSNGEETKKKL